MSLEASRWAWEVQGISSGQKFVLVALADFADPSGECFPSHKTLCKRTGIKQLKTVREHIAALESAGLLERVMRHDQGGRITSNLYRLRLDISPSHGTTRKTGISPKNG